MNLTIEFFIQLNASNFVLTAVVVAQLVEPEVRGLNPVIGKLLYRTFIC